MTYAYEIDPNVDVVNQSGQTPIHASISGGVQRTQDEIVEVIQFLADKGAKLDVWNRKNRYGWTPLMIAEGFRPGNFKPSADTVTALHRVMRAAGVTPPPPTPRPGASAAGYNDPSSGK